MHDYCPLQREGLQRDLEQRQNSLRVHLLRWFRRHYLWRLCYRLRHLSVLQPGGSDIGPTVAGPGNPEAHSDSKPCSNWLPAPANPHLH